MNSLYRRFERLARRRPAAPAVCARPGGAWIRRGDLRARAEALATRLDGAGLGPGDVAMVAIGNRPAFIVAALAVWSRGGVLLPVEEGLPPSGIESARRSFRPAVAVTAPGGRLTVRSGAPAGSRAGHRGAAMIRLTSGTTGAPRGALITPGQAMADGRAIIDAIGITPSDVSLAVVPLGHTYGFDNAVMPFILQGTPILLARAPLPGLILRALASRKPIVLSAVPYLLDLLARQPGRSQRATGLRACVSAGAPLPAGTARAFRARFGVPVDVQYGTTETGGIAFDAGGDAGEIEGRVGAPARGVRIRIDRDGLGRLPAGHGRIVVTGPAVGAGYVPDPSDDFARGRFRTSDIGWTDARGRLHLAGRLSSFVNVSGRKVNPAEVERALLALDGVTDAVALGVQDALRGERLHAWVVARGGPGPQAIRAALARRLPEYMVPATVRIVAAIPRTARGKLDRITLLRER